MIQTTQNQIEEIFLFIEKSIRDLIIQFYIKEDDIIILLPFQYDFFFKEFIHKLHFSGSVFDFDKSSIKLHGVSISFSSPENSCYVYSKDYPMYQKGKKPYFKLEL